MNRRLGENIFFMASQPRTGSTLLQRIVAAHPKVHTIAEPWILLHPLYGLKRNGHSADYDVGLAHDGLEDFLAAISGKEKTYIRALRRFGNTLYQDALGETGKQYFLDKTPRYYFILPDLHRVFPKAKIIVMFRNPLAVLTSVLNTWVRGNWDMLSHYTHDLLYAPRLLLRAVDELRDDVQVVHYEKLVREPEKTISILCEHLGLAFYQEMLEYGNHPRPAGRMGDPVGVHRYSHPVPDRVGAWTKELTHPSAKFLAEQYLNYLGPEVVSGMGYSFRKLGNDLASVLTRPGSMDSISHKTILKKLGLPGIHIPTGVTSSSVSEKEPINSRKGTSSDADFIVSAIVSTYNAERFIRGCLEDLERQTMVDRLEIVVVDSCSPQNERAIVREFQEKYDNIVYIRTKEREPLYTAWNRGIRAARGKYVTNANTDDRHDSRAYKRLVEVLESNPDVALAYHDSAITRVENATLDSGPINAYFRWPDFNPRLLFRGNFIGPHPMWRKNLHNKYGYFDDGLKVAGDYEFWLRMAVNEKFYHIPEVLGIYLDSPNSIEHSNQDIGWKEVAMILKKHWPPEFGSLPPFDSNFFVLAFEGKPRKEPVLKTVLNQTVAVPQEFKVTAIIAAYNEGDVIYHVIRDLVEQGIQVYLIDHHSTDNTVSEASKWLGKGLIKIETFPEDSGFNLPEDVYAWRYILKRKEDIVKELGPGWYIHADADEFRESPWFCLNLKEGIRQVDDEGDNAINFRIFDFKPTHNSFEPGEDVRQYLRYYSPTTLEYNNVQVKCWKYIGQDFDLWQSGGHSVEFEGRRIFPTSFILRHYPIRSQQHGEKKVFTERKNRFDSDERNVKWHAQYDHIETNFHNFVYSQSELTLYNRIEVCDEIQNSQITFESITPPLVSIIILTYNALKYTKKCIQSIQEHTQYPYEIIFIDNHSTDGTKKYLSKLVRKHPNYKLITNKENKGFAAGNNQGVDSANGDYILLLNNDILVADGWLGSMVKALEKDEKIGMVGPLSNNISGRQMIKNVPYKDNNGFLDFAHQIRLKNRDRITPRRRIAGFAILMKKSLYLDVGGLDESFGTGNFEDDDLCLKVRKKGYAIMVDESTLIHHYGSQTFKINNIDYRKSLKDNGTEFIKKWPKVNYEELLELKHPLCDLHPDLLEQASGYFIQGDFEKAFIVFNRIHIENPLSQDALFGSAICEYKKKRYEKTVKYLHRLLELNPDHAGAYNQLGVISAEFGDLDKAKIMFIKAIEIDKTFVDAQRNIGEIFLEQGDYENGVKTFAGILGNHPDDIPTLLRMAELHSEVGNENEAKNYAKLVLGYDPDNANASQLVNI